MTVRELILDTHVVIPAHVHGARPGQRFGADVMSTYRVKAIAGMDDGPFKIVRLGHCEASVADEDVILIDGDYGPEISA